MFTDLWTSSCGKAGTDSFGITLPRPGLLITGSFALKFSLRGFEILLTRSTPRRSNAPWELFLVRNENKGAVVLYCCLDTLLPSRPARRAAPWLQHPHVYDMRRALIYTVPGLE